MSVIEGFACSHEHGLIQQLPLPPPLVCATASLPFCLEAYKVCSLMHSIAGINTGFFAIRRGIGMRKQCTISARNVLNVLFGDVSWEAAVRVVRTPATG